MRYLQYIAIMQKRTLTLSYNSLFLKIPWAKEVVRYIVQRPAHLDIKIRLMCDTRETEIDSPP